jgi:hypothetical protein
MVVHIRERLKQLFIEFVISKDDMQKKKYLDDVTNNTTTMER